MEIEFLYFRDCPGSRPAMNLLRRLLQDVNPAPRIETIEINSEDEALQHRFLGSPSIRINGRDIEGLDEKSEFGLKCRIYPDTGNGVPSEEMILKALHGEK